MPKQKPFVTDQQWIKLEPLRPKYKRSLKGGPKRIGHRNVFEGATGYCQVVPDGRFS